MEFITHATRCFNYTVQICLERASSLYHKSGQVLNGGHAKIEHKIITAVTRTLYSLRIQT
jgi:hypothetical protein